MPRTVRFEPASIINKLCLREYGLLCRLAWDYGDGWHRVYWSGVGVAAQDQPALLSIRGKLSHIEVTQLRLVWSDSDEPYPEQIAAALQQQIAAALQRRATDH